FFFIFVLGGLTGVMVALVPFNWQSHDTHFIVAHLHYVLIGGLLFPLFAGVYYWLPHVTGRLPHDGFSRMVFWLIFIGFNLAFLPMHFTGLLGMPRRAYTYSAELGPAVQWINLLSTAAAMVLAMSIIAFCIDVLLAMRHGRRAPPNPWDAGTLEWALPAPPPSWNFASIPAISQRDPLWEQPGLAAIAASGEAYLAGAPRGVRETLGTSLRAAVPEQVIRLSGSSWMPLVSASLLTVVLALFIAKLHLLASVAFLVTVAAWLRWTWTTGDCGAPAMVDAGHAGAQSLRLPSQSASPDAPGWWGMVILLLVDGSLYASLVFSYFYLWLHAPQWPPSGHPVPPLAAAAIGALLLAASAVAIRLAKRDNARGAAGRARAQVLLAGLSMLGFICLQGWLLRASSLPPQAHAYASVVHVIVGYQGLHGAIAVLMAGYLWLRSRRELVDAARPRDFRIVALFWYYTCALWAVGLV